VLADILVFAIFAFVVAFDTFVVGQRTYFKFGTQVGRS